MFQGFYVSGINYQLGAGPTGYGAGNGLLTAVYVGYTPAVPDHDVTVANNTIKYTNSYPIVLDTGTYNDVVAGNTVIMPNENFIVTGHNNTVQSNVVETVASQGAYFFGIEERSTSSFASDYNTFSNNQTVGCGYQNNQWIITPLNNTGTTCSGCAPVIIVGGHSTGSGNTLIPRPSFP